MSTFPWQADENMAAQTAKAEYTRSLKEQVEQRQDAARARKQAQLQADRADDQRVMRESAHFAAQAQSEIQAQRDREALVARREAHAAAQYAQQSAVTMTREQKIQEYQLARAAGEQQSNLFGGDGSGAPGARAPQRTVKGLKVVQSEAHAEAEAGLARAAASGEMRPDQQADQQAADIRRRAQGSSSIFG